MKFNRLLVFASMLVAFGAALLGGSRLAPPAVHAQPQAVFLPDLTIDGDVLRQSIRFSSERIRPNDCAAVEGCVTGTGRRRLMRFSVFTPNIGTADMVLGDPDGNPLFEFSPCHGHYHFNGYATYELLDRTGTSVMTGRKQAFCLLDSEKIDPLAGPPKYNCGFQGISKGWADLYSYDLDCQWLDVTGIPAGEYQLKVTINPEHLLNELRFDNNSFSVPVRIPVVVFQ
jgi:hypothetical protein